MKTSKLIFVLDALRYDYATAAFQGKHFTNLYTVESTTTICFPSMVTGLTPHEHGLTGLTGQHMEPIPTYASRLREEGYQTAAFLTGPLAVDYGIFHDWQYVFRDERYIGSRGEDIVNALLQLEKPWFALIHAFELHEPPWQRWSSGRFYAHQDYVAAFEELLDKLRLIIDGLDSSSIEFWVTSDHGQALHEDGLAVWGHGYTCHEVVSHIPLIHGGAQGEDGRLYSQQDTIPIVAGWPVKERDSVTTWAFRATPIRRYADGRREELLQSDAKWHSIDPVVVKRLRGLGYIP